MPSFYPVGQRSLWAKSETERTDIDLQTGEAGTDEENLRVNSLYSTFFLSSFIALTSMENYVSLTRHFLSLFQQC